MSSESPPRKLTRLKQNSEFPNSTSFNSNGASHNVSYAKQDNATTVASCKDSEDDILSFDCFASNMQSKPRYRVVFAVFIFIFSLTEARHINFIDILMHNFWNTKNNRFLSNEAKARFESQECSQNVFFW